MEHLRGSGIRRPPFHECADRLVEFMRDHPAVGTAAMV